MDGTRIIRLENTVGTSQQPRIATFEEAFGEYSELFGKKARARRTKRKTARRTRRNANVAEKRDMKAERKRGRAESRQNTRSLRKEGRQEKRISRRASRKAKRQAMRAEQQAARMARRQERKRQQQERKDIKAEREYERELNSANSQREIDNYRDDGYADDGYADDGYADDGYDEYGEEDFQYEDDYDWEDDYGYNFEGEVEVDDADEEQKKAQTIADKIEWNKKLVDRLSEKGNSDGKIKERQERITALNDEMRDFVCFDGDYYDEYDEEVTLGADGMKRSTGMKKPILRRMRKSQRAKLKAREKAVGMRERRRNPRKKRTIVEEGIGAEIENNRIVIPAKSGFEGETGITGIDGLDDFGYESTEIQLGVQGDATLGGSVLQGTHSSAEGDSALRGSVWQGTHSSAEGEVVQSGGTGTSTMELNQDSDYQGEYRPTEVTLGADGAQSNKGLGKGVQIAIGLGIGISIIAILKGTKVL
tara:strand:+ start:1218 stop:2651 length:1434 start_codon:yes stop_codon:yes gene_type:complete